LPTARRQDCQCSISVAEAIVDVKDAPNTTYVSDERAGILRKRLGKGFPYETARGDL